VLKEDSAGRKARWQAEKERKENTKESNRENPQSQGGRLNSSRRKKEQKTNAPAKLSKVAEIRYGKEDCGGRTNATWSGRKKTILRGAEGTRRLMEVVKERRSG